MEHQVGNMKCFYPQKFNDNVVSCGRCPACKQNRVNGWVARLERHMRYQTSALFVTLTYAEGQYSTTKNGYPTLDYSHVQHFFKTLRNIQNAEFKKNIRKWQERTDNAKRKHQTGGITAGIRPERPGKFTYYVAGEYGTKNARPHYHIILFGASVASIHKSWCTGDHTRRVPRGNVHSGIINSGGIRYTLKYINKTGRFPQFHGDDRTPEFSNMSKGIGKNYLTKAIIKWHKSDLLNRYYVPGAGGEKITMPRYYAEKIYTPAERILIAEHLEKISSENFSKNADQEGTAFNQLLQARKVVSKKAQNPQLQKL